MSPETHITNTKKNLQQKIKNKSASEFDALFTQNNIFQQNTLFLFFIFYKKVLEFCLNDDGSVAGMI